MTVLWHVEFTHFFDDLSGTLCPVLPFLILNLA